ncbi:MAG: hypothetical protein ACFFAS_01900 [Promethearchaeota archaeon]
MAANGKRLQDVRRRGRQALEQLPPESFFHPRRPRGARQQDCWLVVVHGLGSRNPRRDSFPNPRGK